MKNLIDFENAVCELLGIPSVYFSKVLDIYYEYYEQKKQKRIYKRDDSGILVKLSKI